MQRRVSPACSLAGLLGFAAVLLAPGQSAVAAVPIPGQLDGRGWEMVSPIEKNGGEVAAGGLLQGAADGQSASFSSASSFGPFAAGAPYASQYISRRTLNGWSTENVTLPTSAGAYGEAPDGVPYRLFSSDLTRGLILNATQCEDDDCPRSYTLRESAGGARATTPVASDLTFAGASPDLRNVALSTCAALTSNASEVPQGEGCDPDFPNLYRWSSGQLSLMNVTPGASLAAPSGAVSTDANRIYWKQGGDLFLREGGVTKEVDDAQGGGGTFQAATPSGLVAFFTKAGHLYRYDALADSAADLIPAGEVVGVLGISSDGSRVYYQTSAGLFVKTGSAAAVQIAPGAGATQPSDYPPATATARVSVDGTHLVFLSEQSLSGYDNTDQITGEPDSQLFVYDAPVEALACVSCNPKGVRPIGPSTIPGAIANGTVHAYKPRALSADGRRLFFDSADALASLDTDNEPDVYEWEAQGTGSCASAGGCLALVSSGRSEDGASFVDASADGSDVFFLTDGSLVPSDPGAVDLYDARVGGGFPLPPDPIPCEGDACQPLPSSPEDPTPGTQVPTGGNPPVSFPKTGCPRGRRAVVRKGKRRCVAKHAGKGERGKGKHGRGRR